MVQALAAAAAAAAVVVTAAEGHRAVQFLKRRMQPQVYCQASNAGGSGCGVSCWRSSYKLPQRAMYSCRMRLLECRPTGFKQVLRYH
jgi:hypothetical protein